MTRSQFDYKIRKFSSSDYTPIADVHNVIYPDHPLTANELAKDDAERDTHLHCERWIAMVGAKVIAHGGFCQWPETYKNGEFTLIGGVIPQHRNRGIGSTLFDIVIQRLYKLGATVLRSHSRSDRDHSIQFLCKRGFVEYMRERDWELNVLTFDKTPYLGLIQRLSHEGIKIRTLRDLKNDPHRDRKLYELAHVLLADTPGAEMHRKLSFDRWLELNIDRPEVPADGYFVAVDDDDYVGKTHFETEESDDTLLTKLTGVISSHRKRGVATALKVTAIEWARLNGYPRIMTDNESNDTPILYLNERLGFSKLPEWIFYKKQLDQL